MAKKKPTKAKPGRAAKNRKAAASNRRTSPT